MGTKLNPGPYDCYTKAAPDEPIFILRAKDPIAPIMVQMWARLTEYFAKEHKQSVDDVKLIEAFNCAEQMRIWRTELVKDAPCICGHTKEQHNTIQDFGPVLKGGKAGPAQEVRYIHCKLCNCPAFKR